MKRVNLLRIATAAVVLALLASCGKQEEAKVDKSADKAAAELKAKAEADAKAAEAAAKEAAKEAEARAIAIEAYIYGYPLVTMEMTRRVMTNVEKPEGTRAPMGQFVRMRDVSRTPTFRDVTAPNADTLYTTAWLDVSKEPWILSIPDMKDRYYLFPMLDGWTNVFQVPGKRTTGTKAQKYAITGPGWTGTLPAGVTEYKSPTGMVWILGRIYCTGTPEDYKAVHALQDQVSRRAAVRLRQALHADARQGRSGHRHEDRGPRAGQRAGRRRLLQAARRAAEDQSAGGRRRADGGEAGQDRHRPRAGLRCSEARSRGRQGHRRRAQAGAGQIMAWMKDGHRRRRLKLENGWLFTTKTGLYGTDYLQRALVTAIGLGANRPQDAVYPTSEGPDVLKKYRRREEVRHALRRRASCRRSTASGR